MAGVGSSESTLHGADFSNTRHNRVRFLKASTLFAAIAVMGTNFAGPLVMYRGPILDHLLRHVTSLTN